MLAKFSSPEWVAIAFVVILTIVIEVVVLWFLVRRILFLLRNYEGRAKLALARCFDGVALHESPEPGDVALSYHTYHGVLVWFTQTHHQQWLPRADAHVVLKRLLRFNLSWGLTSYGALFVPPLAILNYFSQKRSIIRAGAR